MPYSVTANGQNRGVRRSTEPTTKITVHVPTALLERARAATGQGITGTVREGLRSVAASEAYRRLRAFRGKVRFDVDLAALREDRD